MTEREYRKSVRAVGKKKTHDGLKFRADFPQWLKGAIKDKGITQRVLAKALGVCETLVSRWVHGERPPNLVQVMGLAKYFEVSTDEILGVK